MRKSLIAATVVALAASAGYGTFVEGAVGVDSTKLRNAVKVENIRAHQFELQAIANANNGERTSGTPGFDASAEFVKSTLKAAGYTVTQIPFSFPFFKENSPPIFERTAPLPSEDFVEGADFSTMEYSGSGNVTALVRNAGGFVLPPTPDPSSASGCAAADFAGFAPGSIALIQRGTCSFFDKATNARNAGAVAAIIFNEGNPGRTDNFGGTLGGEVGIPVLSASHAVGVALSTGGPTVHITTDTTIETKNTSNLLAETAGGRGDRVVVVGAHLDSVPGGAGIQDNGSGSAGILEIALQMKKLNIQPVNKIRFMWFGAEEAGLLGSENYVASLTARQKKDIALNLNFDMIASPNFVRFVYDGDGSDTADAGPNGSATIEDVFAKYFASQNLPFEATAFDGRSDYGPFIDAGIPAGGLFTGAEELKTAEEAAIYGGTAGVALDPCYHLPCDNYGNNNEDVFDEMADAAADAILQFAMTTSAVKGTSKANDRAIKSVAADSLLYRGGHLQK
jgi:Zn-dependent M28 family amino/carboxypeptidase